MSTRMAMATAILAASASVAHAQPARYPDLPALPRDLEIELALMYLRRTSVRARRCWCSNRLGTHRTPGSNAFTCLVTRRGGDVVPRSVGTPRASERWCRSRRRRRGCV